MKQKKSLSYGFYVKGSTWCLPGEISLYTGIQYEYKTQSSQFLKDILSQTVAKDITYCVLLTVKHKQTG